MQFQNPGFLYFLFALIIPIIVHLFQLRKFKKTPFTNVAFLKKVVLQTRKSSQLKKWLTLLARLLAMACIILAFAQPFFPMEKVEFQQKETIIYLDNSFSMSLKGKRGPLLKRAVQELLENVPKDEKITLITNERIFRKVSLEELKKELTQLNYSSTTSPIEIVLLRAENEFSKSKNTYKEFIAISDFQNLDTQLTTPDNIHFEMLQLSPVNTDNVSIDSVFISKSGLEKIELTAKLSFSGNIIGAIPISVYNGKKLIAKTAVDFGDKKSILIPFALNLPETGIIGKIELKDTGLAYDNSFYFSINPHEKIKVVLLGNTSEKFLKQIYDTKDFNFHSFQNGAFDYTKISQANTVILNELNEIPTSLIPILSKVTKKGGFVVIIPAINLNKTSYDIVTSIYNGLLFGEKSSAEKSITHIVFEHPLYANVFEDKVKNFQYPSVESSYDLAGNFQNILEYADHSPFLVKAGNMFAFSAALNLKNSSFQKSPLVVPTFFNLAQHSLNLPKLYETVGKKSTFSIPVSLGKDEILSIRNEEISFIPRQKSLGEVVKITTEDLPQHSGNYKILKNDIVLRGISYNYDRNESLLQYPNLKQLTGITPKTDIAQFFSSQQQKTETQELWKWFVIFALFFLFIEVLLLKFLK